jgi:hypothetical protein
MDELDLHGVPHYLVRSYVIRKIEEHWGECIDITFVTGNSSQMKNIVIEVIQEYKIDYRDGDFFNTGCIKATV